jgi:hypothetical protein
MNEAAMPPVRGQNNPAVRYLGVFGGLFTVVMLVVLIVNFLVDPYISHQWDSPLVQRLRPTREKLSPWGKTYAVAKYQPQVIYVGNSRTEAGLPADPLLFGGKRVFNGAISGASLADAIAMLQHAMVVGKVDTVVWGVDYWSFSTEVGNTDFDRDLVATDRNYALRRPLLDLKRALSFDMSSDSLALLAGRFGEDCKSSLAFAGQRDEGCGLVMLANRGGVSKAMTLDILGVKNKNTKIEQALPLFTAELSRLCRANVRVMVYINPLHATTLEYFYQQGHGEHLEHWKRLMVRAVANAQVAQPGGCELVMFDFSGFNSVTSETIPEVSHKAAMQNYWEGSHYRALVGQQILAKMLGSPTIQVPADFGVKLAPGNIESHLARIRADREVYRAAHPLDLAVMEKWLRPK